MNDSLDPRIASAIAAMEERMAEPLAVADLAAAVDLSPSRFSRIFARETGTSPAKYLHGLRMARARALVERTFLSIRDVMRQVGINDPSHFARDFRRAHGASPRGLRRGIRYTAPAPRDTDDDDSSKPGARHAASADRARSPRAAGTKAGTG